MSIEAIMNRIQELKDYLEDNKYKSTTYYLENLLAVNALKCNDML